MGQAQRLAEESEAAGAEAVWIADVRREPYLLSAAALSTTKAVEVGTNVAVAFARSPAATAQAAWDLAGWSGGRFVLGLGSQVKGTLERRFGVSAEHPGPMLRDYVKAVRACFKAYREGHGRYEGDYYRIKQPVFMPGEDAGWPEPPIYVAGVNPVMTAIAGECADGFAAHMLSTEAYLDEVIRPALSRGAAGAVRNPSSCSRSSSRRPASCWPASRPPTSFPATAASSITRDSRRKPTRSSPPSPSAAVLRPRS